MEIVYLKILEYKVKVRVTIYCGLIDFKIN